MRAHIKTFVKNLIIFHNKDMKLIVNAILKRLHLELFWRFPNDLLSKAYRNLLDMKFFFKDFKRRPSDNFDQYLLKLV